MIAFAGEYTKQQWGRGIRLAMHPTGSALIFRVVAAAIAVAGVGIIAASVVQGQASAPRLLRTGVGVLLLGYYAAVPYYRAWRASSRPFRLEAESPSLAGVVKNDGILSNASATAEADKWDSYLRAHLRDDIVVLVGSDGLATILPREFFRSESDWQSFRQIVEFNVIEPR